MTLACETNPYPALFTKLHTGLIKPSSVIGTGFKNPKAIAGGWILLQIHQAQTPNSGVIKIVTAYNGKGFANTKMVYRSKIWKRLVEDRFKPKAITINNQLVIACHNPSSSKEA